MTPLLQTLKNGAASKGAASAEADPAADIAAAKAATELAAALESKDPKRIKAAWRLMRDLDDED